MRSALFLATLLSAALAGPALCCPTCSGAVSRAEEGGEAVSSGYNNSIMFMIAVPFTMLGAGAFFVTRAIRNGDIQP